MTLEFGVMYFRNPIFGIPLPPPPTFFFSPPPHDSLLQNIKTVWAENLKLTNFYQYNFFFLSGPPQRCQKNIYITVWTLILSGNCPFHGIGGLTIVAFQFLNLHVLVLSTFLS